MQMTWAERLELKGIEKGIEKGLEKGLERGRHEGMRTLLARQLEQRFGALPRKLLMSLNQLDEPERLQRLGDQILDAESIDDLDL